MKTLLTLALTCVVSLAHAFIYETPDEFSMALDFNSDEAVDLVLVDRANGQVTAGYSLFDGTFAWQEPKISGVLDVAAVTFGKAINGTDNDILLTAPSLNRAQYVRWNLDAPNVQALPGFEPTMIIEVKEIPSEFFATSGMITGARGYALPFFNSPIEGEQSMLSTLFPPNRKGTGITTTWHPAHGNDLGHGNCYMWREDNPNGTQSRVRLARVVPGISFADPYVESVTTQTIGAASADYVIEQNGSNDLAEYWLFTWGRNGTSAYFNPVTLDAITPTIGAHSTFTMPQGIDSIVLIQRPSAAPQVAISLDHGTVVKIYNFDGTNLTFDQNVTPEGGRRASGIVPWKTGNANGGFTLLSRDGTSGPSTHVTRYGRDGSGHYQPLGTDALPKLSKLVRGNVFLWQGEPMVQHDAKLVGLRRAGDWTSNVIGDFLGVSATSESFVSTTQGLANPTVKGAGIAAFNATHLSGNQASSSLSVFTYEGAIGTLDSNVVDFSPAPGRYHGTGTPAAIKVKMSWTGRFVRVLYRLNGGAWQVAAEPSFYTGTATTLNLTSDTLVEAVILSSFTDGPGLSPTTTMFKAAYAIGPSPTPPSGGIDGNGNGLNDAWENLFGVTNPTADDDGDGQSNFAEHNAGTDPHDATKFFTPPASLPGLKIGVARVNTGFCICARWPTNDPSVRLEYSQTLGLGASWLPVAQADIAVEGAEYVFTTLPIPGERARFFRLARY